MHAKETKGGHARGSAPVVIDTSHKQKKEEWDLNCQDGML